MRALFRVLEPNHPRHIIRVLGWKIIHCPETGPSKKASLRNSARSLIERRAEPLGSLNKVLPSAPRVAYRLMRHVHAKVISSVHNRAPSETNQCTTLRIHNKPGPQPWSPPQQSLFDSTRGLPLLGLLTSPYLTFWRRLGTVGTLQQRVHICPWSPIPLVPYK